MRPPFRTEDAFLERFSKLSEAERIDYRRRVEGAGVAALAAALAKEQARDAELRFVQIRTQLNRVNIGALVALSILGVASLIGDLPHLRNASLFLTALWIIYFCANELFLLPYLNELQKRNWYSYQLHAREWASLIGVYGFAEHIELITSQFRGQPSDSEQDVNLAIKGFALLKAEASSAV
jgi:hypothetical protein